MSGGRRYDGNDVMVKYITCLGGDISQLWDVGAVNQVLFVPAHAAVNRSRIRQLSRKHLPGRKVGGKTAASALITGNLWVVLVEHAENNSDKNASVHYFSVDFGFADWRWPLHGSTPAQGPKTELIENN